MNMLRAVNTASWTQTRNGWQLLVDFGRVHEAPNRGTGLGRVIQVRVLYKDQPWPKSGTDVRLTSRVFNSSRTGRPAAFAEVISDD